MHHSYSGSGASLPEGHQLPSISAQRTLPPWDQSVLAFGECPPSLVPVASASGVGSSCAGSPSWALLSPEPRGSLGLEDELG